jgi:hypothetical protein
MYRRCISLCILTAAILVVVTYATWRAFQPGGQDGLPFSGVIVDARTTVIGARRDIPLPAGLHAGDRIDLPALSPAARIALLREHNLSYLPANGSYELWIRPAAAPATRQAAKIHTCEVWNPPLGQWTFAFYIAFLGAIALLAGWRGHDASATGLVVWATTFLLGLTGQLMPSDGTMGFLLLITSNALFLLSRVGFYLVAESTAGSALSPRARIGWRLGFGFLLGLGALQSIGAPIVFLATGWAAALETQYGLILTASYLMPAALLVFAYPRAASPERPRLKWMVGGSALFTASILLVNTPILGTDFSWMVARATFVVSLSCFLYAILRHRIIDFSVVLSRTLVYAITTSLMLGIFALFESVIERLALGESGNMLLQLALPLCLGISLSAVHRRVDAAVEQFVFRRQYRQDFALRRFASDCAFVLQRERLLDLTADELILHVGTPWVAVYEITSEGAVRSCQRGSATVPERLDADDPAAIRLRAHAADIELDTMRSDLGRDGHAFPLRARGKLLGILVIGARPGERYSADERELFGIVAHEVANALFAIRAQANDVELKEARAREAALIKLLQNLNLATP